ncbi:MAG: DMT family transporter [Candidatus Hodarchaeota archaeon]
MVFVWSFSFIIVDISVDFIPPLAIAFYRFIIVSITFLIVDIYKKISKYGSSSKNIKNNTSLQFSKNDWILIVIASFTGISLFFLAQYYAIELIGPSLPALFVCLLAPVLIALLALIFFKERLNIQKILGFIIATIGGFLLITGGNLNTLSPESPNFLGYLFALITPILWSIYSTTTKKIAKNNSSSSMIMNKYIAYFGTIEIAFFLMISGELLIFIVNYLNLILFLCALYLGLGCYVLGYYIWQNSQKLLKSSKVASFLYIEPFLTLLFSFLLQRSETILIWNIIGGVIVLIAVLIIHYEKKKEI